jgi:hypothetical protein
VANTAGDQKPGVNVPAPPADSPGGAQPPASNEAPPPSSEAPAKPKPPPAPPAPTFPAEAMYAGDAEGTDLAIAVAVKGDEAAAYLCDGGQVESWLKGTIAEGKLNLESKNKKDSLVAGLKGKNLTGTVSVGGDELPFTIAVADAPAGLYRGENGATTVGWIVLPNGKQVGIANTGDNPMPAPPLDVEEGAVTMNGDRVEAQKIEGDSTFG